MSGVSSLVIVEFVIDIQGTAAAAFVIVLLMYGLCVAGNFLLCSIVTMHKGNICILIVHLTSLQQKNLYSTYV